MNIRNACLAALVSLGIAGAGNAASIIGQLSLSGYVEAIGSSGMGAATGLDFVQSASGSASPGVPGGVTSFGAGSGSFSGLACANVGGSCGATADIASFTPSPTIPDFLSFDVDGISFDLTSITNISRTSDSSGGSITLTSSGTIHFTGLSDTPGTVTLTAEGSNVTSFSATILATPVTTPEPSSLALLAASLAALALRPRPLQPVRPARPQSRSLPHAIRTARHFSHSG